MQIPTNFLTLANQLNIPTAIAVDLFVRIKNKKGQQDLVIDFASQEGITEREVRQRFASLRNLYRTYNTKQAFDLQEVNYLDEALKGLQAIIGPINKVKAKPKLKNDTVEIFISDIHIPFQDMDAVKAVFDEDADVLNILGDVMDMYSTSAFRQTLTNITVKEELAQARAFMEEASRRFPIVRILTGNHDKRPLRRLQELCPQILPLIQDPLELICQGLDNVEIISTTIPDTAPNVLGGEDVNLDYMGISGDILMGHFEGFYGKEAVERLNNWLKEWAHILKIDPPKIVMQSHVHRLNAQYTPTGTLLLTTGCLCKPMPYQFDKHAVYVPPTLGYIKLERNNNITDLNSVRMIKL